MLIRMPREIKIHGCRVRVIAAGVRVTACAGPARDDGRDDVDLGVLQ